jgi:glycerophosphoryl diester phosphodiesterase
LLAPIARAETSRRPVLASSFDPGALLALRDLAPGLPLGLLAFVDFPADHAVAAAAHLDVQVLALHDGSLWPNRHFDDKQLRSPAFIIEQAHAAGVEFLAWCPKPRRATELIDAGADALCVNDVPAMVAELADRPNAE